MAPTSPFSAADNRSNTSVNEHSSTTSPNYTHQAQPGAQQALGVLHSSADAAQGPKHQTQLSTSSPAGIAVANQVTPERLAHLLLHTGPLAIRHITANLAKQIAGFEKLSLSKQRRLIMGCLDQGYEDEAIIFKKTGWGQWSAIQVEPAADFARERNLIRVLNAKVKDNEAQQLRRESITKNRYETDQHDKFLGKHAKQHPLQDHKQAGPGFIDSDNEDALESDSDFSDIEHDKQLQEDDLIPILKLTNRVSPPLIQQSRRSSSSHSLVKPSLNGISKPATTTKFFTNSKSSRSNSLTPSSPELRYLQPDGKKKQPAKINRRNSSIRSTLSDKSLSLHNDNDHDNQDSDTDEEDWQTIGAVKLRTDIDPETSKVTFNQKDEQDAVLALCDLQRN